MESRWRVRHRVLADRLHEASTRLTRQDVAWRTGVARERLGALEARMARAAQDHVRMCREREAGLTRELGALSPLAVLNRGYALVYDETGTLIKTTMNVAEGQTIAIRLARGRIRTRVSKVEEES
jgi:exodeoxyribonuclease VII large subunit